MTQRSPREVLEVWLCDDFEAMRKEGVVMLEGDGRKWPGGITGLGWTLESA